jgi:hypothetical protein
MSIWTMAELLLDISRYLEFVEISRLQVTTAG